MSNVKKVLTLVACGCICLMVASTASADFTGMSSVNKDDPDTAALCTNAGGSNVPGPLTVCNVYTNFDDPANRLLSMANSDLQVFNGAVPATFYKHPFNPTPLAPSCSLIPVAPDLICDSFVTIGVKCGEIAPANATATDGDFDLAQFINFGHIVGGWFNGNPPNGQGDAGNYPDNAILVIQSSVAIGHSMSGTSTVFWQAVPGGTVVESLVEIECAAKCIEGEMCDDGDACTTGDMCVGGVCSGDPINCDDGNGCTDDSCDPATGQCQNDPNSDPCDDGDACTENDVCSGGSCGGSAVDCNDNNACTDDGCDPASGCTHDDIVCDDGDDCTTDGCDPATGCTAVPDCTGDDDCDDGLLCTIDTCEGNCCVNTDVQCPPGDACNPDNGLCEEIPCQTDEECDDGDVCTTDECTPNGCTNTPISCDDGDACTDDSCDPIDGCQNDPISCDDGDACTDDSCDPASGCANDPISCDDGNECTDDSCDPASGCVNDNNMNMCDDGSLCTENDMCSGGECSGDPVDCGDDLVCDPNTGECVEVSDFLDITPGKCPNDLRRNGLGFVKISLLGTEDLDANDVDVSTLSLSRVDPPGCDGAVAPRMTPRPHVRDRATPFLGELCDCHSRRKDGIDDLDMKFKLSEIVNELCLADMPAGTVVRLELTGSTFGGQPIRAADCVILGRDLGPNP